MVDGIPGLINAIRMIHSISQFYNTTERMTSLFVKVRRLRGAGCTFIPLAPTRAFGGARLQVEHASSRWRVSTASEYCRTVRDCGRSAMRLDSRRLAKTNECALLEWGRVFVRMGGLCAASSMFCG